MIALMLQNFFERLSDWKLLSLVLLPAIIAFAPHLANGFVGLDDGILITRNLAVQQVSLWSLKTMFTTYDPELYIPATLLSYQLEHALFGLNPMVFHTTNLLLHLGSGALVFLIVRTLTQSRTAAGVAATLFAVHPLGAEAVMWAAARKDTLSGFFFFLSLFLYLQSNEDGSKRAIRWSILAFLLGLLAKVSVIMLPFIFLLVDRAGGRTWSRESLKEKIPYFLLALVFGGIALYGKTQNIAGSTPLETLLLATKSTTFYLEKIFWPSGLAVLYEQSALVSIAGLEFGAPLLLTCALGSAFLWSVWQRRNIAALGIGWFLLLLLPNFTNFLKNGYLFFGSDRYAYLASVGIFLLIGNTVAEISARLEKPLARNFFCALMLAIVTLLTWRSSLQARTWQNNETLYRNVLEYYPASRIAANNLGDVLIRGGKAKEGEEILRRAIALDPTLPEAHMNLGLLRKSEGRLAEAIEYFRNAAAYAEARGRPGPEDIAPLYFLGETLEEAGRSAEALQTFLLAAEKGATYAEAPFNLGLQYQKRGMLDEAISAFERALAVDPLYLRARYHLAAVLAERGRLMDARHELETLLDLDPRYEKAAEHLKKIKTLLGE